MSEFKLFFYKGKEDVLNKRQSFDEVPKECDLLKKIRDAFSKVLDGKNLSFLLGCGCSSYMSEGVDVGIPTMAPLAKEFYLNVLEPSSITWLNAELKLDVTSSDFSNNLEKFLGTLHSIYFFYQSTKQETDPKAIKIAAIIKQARNFGSVYETV